MRIPILLSLTVSLGLVGCGGGGGSAASGGAVPPASSFTATGGLIQPRFNHAAVLLKDGRVAVFGGVSTIGPSQGGLLNTAEIYSPSLGTWAPATTTMNQYRVSPRATLQADGTVLIVGGDANGGTGTAEIFDPVTGTFTPTGNLVHPRTGTFWLVPLDSGGDFVVGGPYGTLSAETFSASGGKFSAVANTGSIDQTVQIYAAGNVGNGSVLLLGQDTTNSYPVATLAYNVAGKTFQTGPAPSIQRLFPILVPIGTGEAVLIGGTNATLQSLASAEVVDLAASTTMPTGLMASPRSGGFQCTTLANGKVLVTGGLNINLTLASAELFDPATLAFKSAGTMNAPRVNHCATLMADGRVLISGQSTDGAGTTVPSAEIYKP